MLSIILYGRNDSHGYNLHKRGAISLNAIAELLSDDDDEIIFVDYNTPDDLPTFPEAIADTLNEKAWRRLRILRVRPAHHQRFASKTHLNALEPVARNVALRRSNPANRWVLSTNTDMIFTPHAEGADLTSLARDLPDGFYHLPRFELPEALWETLDRKNGEAIIDSTRRWGQQFHLNEIIRSGGDNLFDGPGDFQLFLRDDLIGIGGFHEEMILGWHVDANIARRMRLLRGEVKSAAHLLWGYHCDHTRQATAYHTADRLENSPTLFVDNVSTANVPAQLDTFGLSDVDIEDIRLGSASSARYLSGLSATIGAPMTEPTVADYISESYGRLGYDVDHVLPFLLDLVSCVPLKARVGYVGARRDMAVRFAHAWLAMGGEKPLVAPEAASWLTADEAGLIDVAPFDRWLADADLFIFEVGAEEAQNQHALSADERYRLWVVDAAFRAASTADVDRQRAGAPARRAIAVNAIHNFFERMVSQCVSVKLTPFSSRIRHGFFVDILNDLVAQASEPTREAARAVGRARPFARNELKRLGTVVSGSVVRGEASETWNDCRTLAAEALALVDVRHPVLGAVNSARLLAFRTKLAAARPSAIHPNIAVGLAPDAGRAVSRLARAEDWEDESFLRFAQWLFPGRDHADLFQRDLWIWERIALAHNAWRPFSPAEQPNFLFIGGSPDLLPVGLANLGAQVDLCDAEALLDGRLGSEDWRGQYAEDMATAPSPMGLAQDRKQAVDEGFRYDGVIIAQNAALIRQRSHFVPLLRRAVDLVRPDGQVDFCVRVQIGMDPDEDTRRFSLSASLIFQARLARLIDQVTELELVGGADGRISERTLDRISSTGGTAQIPSLVHGDYPYLETLGVFSFRKRDRTDTGAGWAEVAEAVVQGRVDPDRLPPLPRDENFFRDTLNGVAIEGFGDPLFGSILKRLQAGRNTERTPRSVIVREAAEEGLALTGFLGLLPPGPYEVEFEVTAEEALEAKLVVVRASQVIADVPLAVDPGRGRRYAAVFNVADDGVEMGVALGLASPAGVTFEVSDAILR